MNPDGREHPLGGKNPLLEDLGIRLVQLGRGEASFEIDLLPRHLNRQGTLQGGVVATLLDAACGYAGLGGREGQPLGHAVTVTLAISYLARAAAGRLRAVGRVTRMGRSIYFSSAELVTTDGVVIATSQGSFKRTAHLSEG